MSYEPIKSGALEDENIQIVNWGKYSNNDNSISKYNFLQILAFRWLKVSYISRIKKV